MTFYADGGDALRVGHSLNRPSQSLPSCKSLYGITSPTLQPRYFSIRTSNCRPFCLHQTVAPEQQSRADVYPANLPIRSYATTNATARPLCHLPVQSPTHDCETDVIRFLLRRGAYKYIAELYHKKQSDVMLFLQRVRYVLVP